jgi:hypothetical protein
VTNSTDKGGVLAGDTDARSREELPRTWTIQVHEGAWGPEYVLLDSRFPGGEHPKNGEKVEVIETASVLNLLERLRALCIEEHLVDRFRKQRYGASRSTRAAVVTLDAREKAGAEEARHDSDYEGGLLTCDGNLSPREKASAGSAARNCQGCGKSLAGAHGGRRWCSERCRKMTLYSQPCPRCGAPMNGSDGLGPDAPVLCKYCNGDRLADENRAKAAAFLAEVEALWATGATIREMARELGWKRDSLGAYITRARREGAALPYRNRMTPASLSAIRRASRKRAAELHRQAA